MKNIRGTYWEVKTKRGSKIKINDIGKLNMCLTEGRVTVRYCNSLGHYLNIKEEIVEVTKVTNKD